MAISLGRLTPHFQTNPNKLGNFWYPINQGLFLRGGSPHLGLTDVVVATLDCIAPPLPRGKMTDDAISNGGCRIYIYTYIYIHMLRTVYV